MQSTRSEANSSMDYSTCLHPDKAGQQYDKNNSFTKECDKAPRLTNLATFFMSTAAGRSGRPLKKVRADRRFLGRNEQMSRLAHLFEHGGGPFDQHYYGSIPYRLEDDCRLGFAILQYQEKKSEPLHVYTLGSAEGTMARSLSELTDGRIKSLACSPTVENYQAFIAHGNPPNASFFVGPFHHLTPDLLSSRADLKKFTAGFDIIYEDTTFQMYSANRRDQIGFVLQHLKEDGLLILLEKFRHPNEEEYQRRELQKDDGFKARYFRPEDITAKRKEVLSSMNPNEVTLDDMVQAIRPYFRHCYVIWNSGNFYTLLASNNLSNINCFLAGLIEPAIPSEYVYETIPRLLFGCHDPETEA